MPTIETFRSSVDELTRLAAIDLQALWAQASAGRVSVLLTDVLPDLASVYGSAAGALAADHYDDARLESEVPGRFRALAAPTATEGQIHALAGWAAAETDDLAAILDLARGGLQRLIANVSRDTITTSAVRDPQATGWQRSAAAGCGFCQMLASRGAVYSSSSVDFGAHDHCRCVAVPAFRGRPAPVKSYQPSERSVTDADRARTLEWMGRHGY